MCTHITKFSNTEAVLISVLLIILLGNNKFVLNLIGTRVLGT